MSCIVQRVGYLGVGEPLPCRGACDEEISVSVLAAVASALGAVGSTIARAVHSPGGRDEGEGTSLRLLERPQRILVFRRASGGVPESGWAKRAATMWPLFWARKTKYL